MGHFLWAGVRRRIVVPSLGHDRGRGDSTRDGCWALVRLRVDGERIVDADADGLDTDVRGLSLLEAAAVGGETLAVDALANAIGPVFRARPLGRTASPSR